MLARRHTLSGVFAPIAMKIDHQRQRASAIRVIVRRRAERRPEP
jgi:hypothetical protein